jgi:hypothetical protein
MNTPQKTKVKSKASETKTSKTDPNDPDAIPAFETSAGIKPRAGATKPVYVNKYALENFNSQVSPEVLKNQLEAANVASLFARRAVRPDEVAALRRRMFEVVSDGLEDVAQVISGKKQWNNVQVRLFSILTERVMPKLSTITTEDPSKKKLEEMSIEELEALARGKRNHEAVDAIVKQGNELEAKAEATEKMSAGPKLSQLKNIASIDDAEKAYVRRKTAKPKEGLKLKKS